MFRSNDVIPVYRLIFLGILILLFRRLPTIFLLHRKIHQIEEFQQAAFVGFFGPIGVSAVFYLYVSLDFLNQVTVNGDGSGEVRSDAAHLKDVMTVVIWFLAICSIVVHGLSVPIGKVGYHLPRTMSMALSTSQDNDDHSTFHSLRHIGNATSQEIRRRRTKDRTREGDTFRIGGSVVGNTSHDGSSSPLDEPPRPVKIIDTPVEGAQTPRRSGEIIRDSDNDTRTIPSEPEMPRSIQWAEQVMHPPTHERRDKDRDA